MQVKDAVRGWSGRMTALSDLAATPAEPRRRRRTPWLIAVVVILVAAGVAVAITFGAGTTSHTGSGDNTDPTSLYTVARQDLSSQTQVPATLGYAGSYSVVNQAQGTVASLPAVGQVVRQGQILYRVDSAPVVLLYGTTPAYRSLSEGASSADLTGPDIEE